MHRSTIDLALKLTVKTLSAVSPQGERVILKLTEQREVKVLRRLHGNPPTEHTRIIPLLDVIDGRLMVLPRRTPLLLFDFSDDDAALLAVQFLEGVAYLQSSSVAHLDLKPDNIVVQRDPESKVALAIIDFNISIFADDEPTTSRLSGTPGWSAPEVSAEKPYNPLLADRWSCGCVLTFFTERMKAGPLREEMRSLSQRLMNPDPSLRPSISNWYPQKMGWTLNPLIRPIASDLDGAPEPRSSRRLKGSRLQLKRRLSVDAKEKEEVKRMRKSVQPGSRLVSQRVV